jgi:malonyl-CoA O-methyltransferase
MRVSPLEAHEIWAPRYDSDINPLLALETRSLIELLGPVASRRFLDVACGTGRWMRYLEEHGGAVFGADLCQAMLRAGTLRDGTAGRHVQAEATLLPFPDSFADTTLCALAAGYLPDLRATLCELARVTRPGGRVIVTDLHPAAIDAGWTRSFRAGSRLYEIDHFAHTDNDFRQAGENAGLTLCRQLDAHFSDPERELFQAAGKERVFQVVSRIPAVWIGVWGKP